MKLWHKLRAAMLIARARRIRAEAQRLYRISCNHAAYLDRLALRHSRLAGRKLLQGTTRETVQKVSRSGLSLEGIRAAIHPVRIVQ